MSSKSLEEVEQLESLLFQTLRSKVMKMRMGFQTPLRKVLSNLYK